MSKIRIAVISGEVPASGAGGIATVVEQLRAGFEGSDIELSFFCSQSFARTGFPAFYLKQWGPHPLHDLSFGRSFARLDRELDGFDAYDFHLPNARGPLLMHRLPAAKCIATMHTTSLGYKRNVYDRLPFTQLSRNEKRQKLGFIRVAIALERRALSRCAVINCVSDNVLTEVRDWYGYDNVVRSHKSVNLAVDAANPALERADDAPFLFVGRLVAQKGLFDLLDAYVRSGTTRQLQIVGDGLLRTQLEARAKGLNVSFLGYLDKAGVMQRLSAAHALVVPSLYETQPMVAFEAAANALPVIGYDTAAIGDAVAEANGPLILPCGDIHRLAAVIADLDRNPGKARVIGRANHDHHIRYNHYQMMLDDYRRIYESVANCR
jgi:glycosyltransferase involved in cell wall biosynthesis